MVTENSMELENQAFLSNQDITGEAPRLLLCSSIASGSDLGSNEGITPMAGIGKEYPEFSWYYLYLSNKELKTLYQCFQWQESCSASYTIRYRRGEILLFQGVFLHCHDHRKRFEQCAYTKEEYTVRRDSARIVKEAFATGSIQKLNTLTDEKGIEGNGWLFCMCPLGAVGMYSVCHASPPVSGDGL